MNITQQQYTDEIDSLATMIVDDAKELWKDEGGELDDLISDFLHETIDGHEWIRYNAYNSDILTNSDNHEYCQDIYSDDDLGAIVRDQGVAALTQMMAFWALYADVQTKLQEIQDDA